MAMITNFETVTFELTEDELKWIPYLINGFNMHGPTCPIKEVDILAGCNRSREKYGIKTKMTGARLRKLVNYIRVSGLVPLLATSKGYFVTDDPNAIEKQIRSLYERAASIKQAAEGLRKFLA